MKKKVTLISQTYNITLITLFRYDTEENRNSVKKSPIYKV